MLELLFLVLPFRSASVEAYVDITRIEMSAIGIELFDRQCLGTALCPRFSRDFGLHGKIF